jgi:hypothetical protein
MRILTFVFLAAATAFAQGELRVYRGSVVAAENVPGKLAITPDLVLFLDEERPEASFYTTRANIQSVSAEAEAVTIQLAKGVRDRSGDTTRVIVRLTTPAEAAEVQRWFSAAPAAGANASSGGDGVLTFSAQRKKRLRGNTDGKLIIDNERLIFESLDNASDSRRWELKEIRELKHKNAYELEIRPFSGPKYELMLSGAGMDDSQFRQIVERVTRSRTAR